MKYRCWYYPYADEERPREPWYTIHDHTDFIDGEDVPSDFLEAKNTLDAIHKCIEAVNPENDHEIIGVNKVRFCPPDYPNDKYLIVVEHAFDAV